MTTETKALTPFNVKRVRDDERTFEGLASTWDLDLGNDVIHPGAFAETLRYWKKTRRVIPLIDQHDYTSVRSVLGKLVAAQETKTGLLTRFQVVQGPDGDALLARIRDGLIDGLSIGYEAINPKTDTQGVRHLREVKLREVSVVIWGMNPNALITSASKSLFGRLTPEQKAQFRTLLDGAPAAAAPTESADPQRSTVPIDAEAEMASIHLWAAQRGIIV